MTKLILGIETSCDDTSVAILKDSSKGVEILAHGTYGQEDSLSEWGGVVPEIAARNHLQKMAPLLKSCFKKAELDYSDIDLIGVTALPGLLGPLLTGLNAAKTLALYNEKPVLPVNHLYAHLEAIHLTEKMEYPYLGLLISGGHSAFFLVNSKDEFKVLGGTIDDAAGEAFDKGGKLLGLGYPAGRVIDELSKKGDPLKHDFPIGLKSSADCRFSFSGLKTSLRVFLENAPQMLEDKESQEFYDVCASYQEAIVKALALKTKYAFKKAKELTDKKEIPLVVGGGVACNSAIRARLKSKFNNVHFVSPAFCADNGAMIANYARINQDKAVPFPDCLSLDARGRFIDKKDFRGKTS